MQSPTEDVLYESPHPTIATKLLVALGTGVGLGALTAFTLWAPHAERTLASVRGPSVISGALGFVVIVVAIFAGRTVRRVVVDRASRALVLHRDPHATERYPLKSLRALSSEPTVGGWSRDPAERLVLSLDDGRVLKWDLPDDADTPGIVKDLEVLRAEGG